MSNRPNPLRIPGETDKAFLHFRSFARAGGAQPDGTFLERPSKAAHARNRNVQPDWMRELARRHGWEERLIVWDNKCAEFFDRKLIRQRDWTRIFSSVVDELESRGPSTLSGAELTALARLAASEMKAEREAAANQPTLIDGITTEDLQRLAEEEQRELARLLEKATGADV